MNEDSTAIANDRPEGLATTDTAVEDEEVQTPEVEEPETEEETPEGEADTEEGDDTDDDETAEEEDDTEEELEFNFGGNKLLVPKGKVPKELAEKMQEYGNGLQTS